VPNTGRRPLALAGVSSGRTPWNGDLTALGIRGYRSRPTSIRPNSTNESRTQESPTDIAREGRSGADGPPRGNAQSRATWSAVPSRLLALAPT